MLILCLILSTWGFPAGIHSGSMLYTDLAGSSLYINDKLLSAHPGSGLNPVSIDHELYWKECPPGEDQRIVNESGEILFTRQYFSGPYKAPSGEGLMVTIPGEILLLNTAGITTESISISGYPGSLAASGEYIWFVSSETGHLVVLEISTQQESVLPLNFTPLTVQHHNSMLLLQRADGQYSLTDLQGLELFRTENAFSAQFLSDGSISVTRWSETQGCLALAWETVQYSQDERVYRESVSAPRDSSPDLPVNVDPAAHFDVPYIHQRWDTPDWFNGSWSCGPTSCLMGAQYYNRLTPDSIWCSSPYGHWSSWGNYIPTEYTFLGYTYDIEGLSPSSVWVPGAHGFICRSYGGAGWNEMTWWLDQHGVESSWLGTTWSACTDELDNGWPVIASTTSAYTGGHILLFNGYYDNHSVICNDAYGNQNASGWGTMINGKDVVYDWPGYNNGNVQLGVSQLFSARSEPLTSAGEIVDDRTLGFEKLGPCEYWHEQTTGYNGYSWWTYSTGAPPDTCIIRWNPDLPQVGEYLVEAWIPSSHAVGTGIYHINTTTGWEMDTLNQSSFSDQWAALGTWQLNPSTAQVRMGDYTGTQGQYIAFDALKFTFQVSTENDDYLAVSQVFQLSQNPVPSSSPVSFILPDNLSEAVRVYSMDGRLQAVSADPLPAGALQPGIYMAVIGESDNEQQVVRFTVTE